MEMNTLITKSSTRGSSIIYRSQNFDSIQLDFFFLSILISDFISLLEVFLLSIGLQKRDIIERFSPPEFLVYPFRLNCIFITIPLKSCVCRHLPGDYIRGKNTKNLDTN